jgi:hypothetical protein
MTPAAGSRYATGPAAVIADVTDGWPAPGLARAP